jgi:hypothetical protein
MEQPYTTALSTLTEDELLTHLYNKENPTPEELEAALRLEMLKDSYNGLLEDINREAKGALAGRTEAECASCTKLSALARIRNLTRENPVVASTRRRIGPTLMALLLALVVSVAWASAFVLDEGIEYAQELAFELSGYPSWP